MTEATTSLNFQRTSGSANRSRASARPKSSSDDVSLTSTFVFILWLSCVGVGVLGYAIPYTRPKPPVPVPPPVQAEILNVELANDPLPPPDLAPSSPDPARPPLLDPIAPLPPTPPFIAVAELTPAIAFPMPVEGPVRIVEVKQAAYVQQTVPIAVEAAPAPPPVQTITYGRGAGRQPAPDYPRQAVREGQEGTVSIRFSLGEDGRVRAAEVSAPSPWPLLNQAALRVVRERWRFLPGTVRLYEVSIRFELTK